MAKKLILLVLLLTSSFGVINQARAAETSVWSFFTDLFKPSVERVDLSPDQAAQVRSVSEEKASVSNTAAGSGSSRPSPSSNQSPSSTNLPDGCTSRNGFSTTTGLPCDGSTLPTPTPGCMTSAEWHAIAQALGLTPAQEQAFLGITCAKNLPQGLPGQTLRHNGSDWEANSVIYNNGEWVGINTRDPDAELDLNGNIKIRGGAPALGKVLTSDANGFASWQAPKGGVGGFWEDAGGGSIQNTNDGTVTVHNNAPTGGDITGLLVTSSNGPGVWGITNGAGQTAVQGDSSNGGSGVSGSSSNGGRAVQAYQQGTGYGFFQSGTSGGKNYFQSRLGIGVEPAAGTMLDIVGKVKITDGSQGAGKVLTSDAAGLATWQAPAIGGMTLPLGGAGYTLRATQANNWVAATNMINDGTNIGIGLAAPLTPINKLDVQGALGLRSGTPLRLYSPNNSGWATISMDNGGIVNANYPWTFSNNLGIGGGPQDQQSDKSLLVHNTSGPNSSNIFLNTDHLPNNDRYFIDAWTNPNSGTRQFSVKHNGNGYFGGTLEVKGGIKLDSGPLPTCNEVNRGTFYFVAGSDAFDDHLYFCLRRAGVLSWFGGE